MNPVLIMIVIIEEMLWFCFNCFDGWFRCVSVDYDGRSWKKGGAEFSWEKRYPL